MNCPVCKQHCGGYDYTNHRWEERHYCGLDKGDYITINLSTWDPITIKYFYIKEHEKQKH